MALGRRMPAPDRCSQMPPEPLLSAAPHAGLPAPDLFQAAGYNQDTILVTSSITPQLTAGSKRSGTEGDGPSLIEPQCSTELIMYTVKHFPSQQSENSNSTPSPLGYPPPTLIQLFSFYFRKMLWGQPFDSTNKRLYTL